jgi:alcohol dehydrogenase (cytochrome c)
MGESMESSPMTYELDGRQYILTSGGSVLFAWALPESAARPAHASPAAGASHAAR